MRCPGCGAQLRQGRRSGSLCDPCRVGENRLALPAGFYDAPVLVKALADYDFGRVFRVIRAQTTLTQRQLGDILGFDQTRISAIERGDRGLHDIRDVVHVAMKCNIPAEKLGFSDTVGTGSVTMGKGEPMDRRDLLTNFVGVVASVALGTTAALAADLDRLSWLLDPDPDDGAPRQVGVRDVAALERLPANYRAVQQAHGGGYARDAAVAQLRATLPLLQAQVDPAVRDRLFAATTHLALIAGWIAFDTERHGQARRIWLAGLRIARQSDSPACTDLTSHLLFVMAQQALELRRPDEAQRFCQIGQAAAVGAHSITPSTRTALAINTAFTRAQVGDPRGCERALGTAEEEFGRIDFADITPWACVDSEVKLRTWQGHARYELARATGDDTWTGRALPELHVATTNRFTISRALYLPELAGAHARTGDVDEAVRVGHQAADLIGGLYSARAVKRLRVLADVLEPMSASPGVTELRQRIHATTSAA